MSAIILKGKDFSDSLRRDLKTRAAALAERRGTAPHLAVVAIGGDITSQIFLRKKLEACKTVGIDCTVESLPETTTETEALRLMQKLGRDQAVDGIILDMPVPRGLGSGRLLESISPDKDVEGVTTANTGRLYAERSYNGLKNSGALIPCTANAIILLLLETGLKLEGLNAVVVGRSNIVGRPVAHMLSCLDATVTICHSATRDLESHIRRAEILVSCTGIRNVIEESWIQPGAAVIDAGMHSEGSHVTGDLDFDAAAQRAGFITPVPGGVGPVTVTCLLANTVLSAERRVVG